MSTPLETTNIVKIQPKGQVTLSPKLRAQAGISVGDYVEIIQEKGRIVLIPQEMAPRHPAIDAAIKAGMADVKAGRVTPAFKNMKEYHAWCKTSAGKKVARS